MPCLVRKPFLMMGSGAPRVLSGSSCAPAACCLPTAASSSSSSSAAVSVDSEMADTASDTCLTSSSASGKALDAVMSASIACSRRRVSRDLACCARLASAQQPASWSLRSLTKPRMLKVMARAQPALTMASRTSSLSEMLASAQHACSCSAPSVGYLSMTRRSSSTPPRCWISFLLASCTATLRTVQQAVARSVGEPPPLRRQSRMMSMPPSAAISLRFLSFVARLMSARHASSWMPRLTFCRRMTASSVVTPLTLATCCWFFSEREKIMSSRNSAGIAVASARLSCATIDDTTSAWWSNASLCAVYVGTAP
eukprot:Unigene3466_Nuclearia_a/m.10610 Unigene3466_Nuclearia_a/g.10610  ORF Unigene3466_Nuclearia_a/g.10610 Unigene3466_Nuclearia_a/m.10610 type:complete len:312 (-) Unigene3466_Nuclearia_a:219-1154(-)